MSKYILILIAFISFPAHSETGDSLLNYFSSDSFSGAEISDAVKVFVVLTVLSLAPSILVMMTSFTRIIIVLSILRQALGMQQTPPNSVLISLALFLTIFSMSDTINEINTKALKPLSSDSISLESALDESIKPIKSYMLEKTRDKDLAMMIDISNTAYPNDYNDIDMVLLIPAFMISELIAAFKIGFIIFLPFLLIDIVVAGLLMSLGMMMVPPMMMSLPIKILVFVLIDGWSLVIRSLMDSI